MHVLFIAPHFPDNQVRYAQALKGVGAKVTGIGEPHAHELPSHVASILDGWEQVHNVTDPNALYEAVRRVQNREWVDRLEATIESHMLAAAKVREACTIPGLTYQQTLLCRDKTLMKEFMREHGIPCAASAAVNSAEEVAAFGREHGYPLIIKPRDGAGANQTWRLDSEAELAHIVYETGLAHGHSIAVEEFIEGHEGFYDTLIVNGEIRHDFISHYYPNVLEAMRHRWISPLIICTNRHHEEGYSELKAMGSKVVRELGLSTTPTHMEWFFGPKGLKFSEIGARPPGVSHWDIYCAANDIDLYKEWADGIVHQNTWGTLSRQYSAAQLALRPTQDGIIQRYEGIDEMQAKHGEWVFDAHFPPVGSHTQPIEKGYKANAWIHIKHPDYDALREICLEVSQKIKVIAG
ncbi:MAG: ATPase [Chloroflexota bacterium]